MPTAIFSWIGNASGWLKLVGYLVLAIAALTYCWKAVVKIETGEIGIYMRSAKVVFKNGRPRIHGAGIHIRIPGVYHYRIVDITDRANDLGEIELDDAGDVQYKLRTSIVWRVRSEEPEYPYRAEFATKNALSSVVTNCCEGVLEASYLKVRHFPREELNARLLEEMHRLCEEDLLVYGVELRAVNLATRAKTAAQKLSGLTGGTRPSPAAVSLVEQIAS